MKTKKYASALLCALFMAVSALLCVPAAYAEGAAPEVSSADVSSSDIPADFTRVLAVPANVDIPDFYQEVINVSGMYIFTLPDGTVYKRIYGAIDDVYGWYIPVGQENIVYAGSHPIDPTDDALLYYAAVSVAERESMERQDFSGLLPPDEGVTEVEQVNGMAMNDVVFYCAAGAVLLCLLITIGATKARSGKKSEPGPYPPRPYR